MLHSKPPIKTIPLLIAISGLIAIGSIGYIASLSSAFAQEPDSLSILKTALQLELTRANVALVNSSSQRLLVRDNAALSHYLHKQGWSWTDQMGARVVYQQNSQRLHANCGMYSRHYMICDLDRKP